MDFKEKSKLGWSIANWLHLHENFEQQLADNIFFGMEVGQEISESDLQKMLENEEGVTFTASDLLRYLNRKDRQAKLIEKYAL